MANYARPAPFQVSCLDHVTAEAVIDSALGLVANTKSILVASVWRRGEDAQVDHPGSGVELRVDSLDAEVVLVTSV